MAKTVLVSDKQVRAWFKDNPAQITDEIRASVLGNTDKGARGRLAPEAKEIFQTENPGTEVAEGKGVDTLRPLTYVKQNAKGANRTYTVNLPVSEIRALSGTTKTVGRLSKADLEAAGQAYLASL